MASNDRAHKFDSFIKNMDITPGPKLSLLGPRELFEQVSGLVVVIARDIWMEYNPVQCDVCLLFSSMNAEWVLSPQPTFELHFHLQETDMQTYHALCWNV